MVDEDGALQTWLKRVLAQDLDVEPLQGDASSRIYYRVKDDKASYILMVAPPDNEFRAFINIANLLRDNSLNVPKFHAVDEDLGLILMSDFGDDLYLQKLNQTSVEQLYKDAIDSLIRMQKIKQTDYSFKVFDKIKVQSQMGIFSSWYLEKHLKISVAPYFNILEQTTYELNNKIEMIPMVFTHLDYHSRNLIVTKENNPGILDFQDAMWGPCTYDLVSLLNDCYIDWGEEVLAKFIAYYKQQAIANGIIEHVDYDTFMDWFDYCALQRHLKNLGVFCRLNYRDSKDNYLQYIPRLLMYIDRVIELRPEFNKLKGFIQDIVLPMTNDKIAV